jgi:hypothetical protein
LASSDVRLPVAWQRPAPWIDSIIAIDPIAELLQAMADKKLRRRADLLIVGCKRDQGGVQVCLVPVEIKHHGNPTTPQGKPDNSDPELRRAREQLTQSYEMLQSLGACLNSLERPMLSAGRRLALLVLIDFALDFGVPSPTAAERSAVLDDILRGRCSVSVGTPCLFWFAPRSISLNGAAF